MKLLVPVKILRALSGEDSKYPELEDMFSSWRRDSDTVSIDTNSIVAELVIDIEEFMKEDKNPMEEYSPLQKRIKAYHRLTKEGSTKAIKRLIDIPDAFVAFMREHMPNQLIYTEDEEGAVNPYVAIDCSSCCWH